ncbi:hypothetical protein [Agromyces seonyuensis]|uniref:hypothetical protein n=1 Tax=Agromyces seonyuensis TaxID=2662446 RepID=UPI001365C4D4|nr:hypothetical protein [Agromyces seonyuensis]
MTSAGRTWCDLAQVLTVPELVAVADRVPEEQLVEALARHPGRRHRRKLLVALGLRDPASESPPESVLRALVVLAGLPAPRVNVDIHDRAGDFVARVDQLFDEYGEILEYQGDHHRTDQQQWRRDRTREAELESLGFHVTEVTSADLARPRELVERIARNLRRRGWAGAIEYSPCFPTRSPVPRPGVRNPPRPRTPDAHPPTG